jgi:hypothetical protein
MKLNEFLRNLKGHSQFCRDKSCFELLFVARPDKIIPKGLFEVVHKGYI